MSRASASVRSTRLSESGMGCRSREFQAIPLNMVADIKCGSVIERSLRAVMRFLLRRNAVSTETVVRRTFFWHSRCSLGRLRPIELSTLCEWVNEQQLSGVL
jgi:hypothetical protein